MKIAVEMYTHVVEVMGRHAFPVDMLRYDRLSPRHEGDSTKITDTIREPAGPYTRVELYRQASDAWKPTTERWASFGWIVTKHFTLEGP